MSDGIKLIGYSSDEEGIDRAYNISSKRAIVKSGEDIEFQEKMKTFLVNTASYDNIPFPHHLKRYSKTKKALSADQESYNRHGGDGIKKPKQPKVLRTPHRKYISDFSKYRCCYCECKLDFDNYTREHLTPKERGGKNDFNNLRPCCSDCNQEKGNLMLHSYIQFLNYSLNGIKFGPLYLKLQKKIKNVNRLAAEING